MNQPDARREAEKATESIGAIMWGGRGAAGALAYQLGRYLEILNDITPTPPLGGSIRPTMNMIGALLMMWPLSWFVASLGLFFFVPVWAFILAMATVFTAPKRRGSRFVEFSSWSYLAMSALLGALHVWTVQSRLGLAGAAIVILAIGLMNLYWFWYARRYLGDYVSAVSPPL